MVRIKHRYLLLEFLLGDEFGGFDAPVPPNFNEGAIVTVIRESVSVNFGEAGYAEVGGGLTVKYFSPTTRTAIVRVARSAAPIVWASLTFVRQIKGVDCCVRVLHCGGTIRKTQQAAIVEDRKRILASGKAMGSDAASLLTRMEGAVMAVEA